MRTPVLGPAALLGAVVVGVTGSERTGWRPGTVGIVAGATVALGALAVRTAAPEPVLRRRVATALLTAVLGLATLGAAVMGRAMTGLERSPVAVAVADRTRAVVSVTLVGEPSTTRFAARVLARVDRMCPVADRCRAVDRIVTVDASGAAATRLVAVGAGDRLRLRGTFRPLDRYEASARWRHAVGAFAAEDLLAFRGPSGPLPWIAGVVRATVGRGLAPLPEPQRALVRGFLLGGTSGLPDAVLSDFRTAGLTHLVVVSGGNVAFVLVLIGPLLRRLGPRLRPTAALGVLLVFAAVTRFEPSVLRASVMAACALVAGAAGRPTSGIRLLLLAVTILVLVDPFLVRSVGFGLSVAATAGIAVGARPLADRLPGPRPLAEVLGVTAAAQLAVAPLLIATFGSVPLVSVVANVAAAPFVGLLTVSGLAGALLGGLVPLGVVGAVAGFPAWGCATAVLTVAAVAARVPVAVGWRGLGLVVVSVATVMFAVGRSGRATWGRADSAAPRPSRVPPR